MQKLPSRVPCAECLRIASALQVAWRADNQTLRMKLRDVADRSGRDFRQFGLRWVFSIATMPDEEMNVLLESHYPKVAEARRTREELEKASGHSLTGWYMLLNYVPNERE
jgi:hypothetical protein